MIKEAEFGAGHDAIAQMSFSNPESAQIERRKYQTIVVLIGIGLTQAMGWW